MCINRKNLGQGGFNEQDAVLNMKTTLGQIEYSKGYLLYYQISK